MVRCFECGKKLKVGSRIQLVKWADVTGKGELDYEDDGRNHDIICEECFSRND